MRILLLLRGSPGCGKTTWIEKNGLKPYTLSADDIRMMCQSPILTVNGGETIDQTNDKLVWQTLFKLLENRMEKGAFTVIDATNSKTTEMNRYKTLCETYRYRIYCVDFTDIPIDEAKRRNKCRPLSKVVPEEVIDKMYSRFATQKIPSGIKVIRPDELDSIWIRKIDLSQYNKVHMIGDIHGCCTVLKEYMDANWNENDFYIFCGDYIDRGIENVQVINYLLSIYTKPNVLLLEGNHERWLQIYAHGGATRSQEFETHTRAQLDAANFDKRQLRQLYRKLGQCAYFSFGDYTYIVTHGGLSQIPINLSLVPTHQMIHGVGGYSDYEKVADTFYYCTPEKTYQVFGHRNIKNAPIQLNDKVFDLEGGVEFGGFLRCVQFAKDGSFEAFSIKNNVYRQTESKPQEVSNNKTVADIIVEFRNNKYIKEKKFGNISSFNFTPTAFYEKIWNSQTIKARGLYIDIEKQKVVARSYEKFFRINERPETKLEMLQYKLQFPISIYVKENGFLGIVSYDEYKDDLFVTTKSDPTGDYAEWLKAMLCEKLSDKQRLQLKEYCKQHNVSFIFECVDMKNDPHIIEYQDNQLYLLDIIKNAITFEKLPYEDLCHIGHSIGLLVKTKACDICTWQDFYDWYHEVNLEDYEYNGAPVEGFVIEDSTGYMVKVKLHYYNFWKFMRGISHETLRKGYISKTSSLTSALANQYYGWLKSIYDPQNRDQIPKDIITLRKMFYIAMAEKEGVFNDC